MPCGQTDANAVFYRIGTLAWNLYQLFTNQNDNHVDESRYRLNLFLTSAPENYKNNHGFEIIASQAECPFDTHDNSFCIDTLDSVAAVIRLNAINACCDLVSGAMARDP